MHNMVSSMMVTKAAEVMRSVRYSPMNSSCGTRSSPTHRNVSTLFIRTISRLVDRNGKENSTLNLHYYASQDLLCHDREQLILNFMGSVF